MTSESAPQIPLEESMVAQLACPACHGDLRSEPARLLCTACGRAYPVVDGIPVLIADRAENGIRS